jgi:hypothetical protein
MSERRIVQFIHPGGEHGADRWNRGVGWKDWNCGDHKRKFLLADGSWTENPQKPPTNGKIMFWGEWEPQSRVNRLNPQTELHPQHLHSPHLDLDAIKALPKRTDPSCNVNDGPQNTDPLVFGPQFFYVLCQQPVKITLRSLNIGDIILFGSHKGGNFLLDTVFVIGIHAPIHQGGPSPNWESELHCRITMDLAEIPGCGLRLYGGETWTSEKPFSFVPCRPAEPHPIGFARPVIRHPLISSTLRQGCKIETVNAISAREFWSAVVQQVLLQNCAMGTFISEPDLQMRAPA